VVVAAIISWTEVQRIRAYTPRNAYFDGSNPRCGHHAYSIL